MFESRDSGLISGTGLCCESKNSKMLILSSLKAKLRKHTMLGNTLQLQTVELQNSLFSLKG